MSSENHAHRSIDSETATPHELAAFYFQCMEPLAELMAAADLATRKDIPPSDLRRTSLGEAYLRCAAWARTLSVLDSLVHVQAVGATEVYEFT